MATFVAILSCDLVVACLSSQPAARRSVYKRRLLEAIVVDKHLSNGQVKSSGSWLHSCLCHMHI